MLRKIVTLTLALAMAHVTSLVLENAGVLQPGASAQAIDLTAASGIGVLRDTFDDNSAGTMWQVLASRPDFCAMKEVNRRLELQASRLSNGASAGYIASGWRLSPQRDFSVRVDYYYDLVGEADGWVSLGVTADPTNPWEKNAAVGVGCMDGFAHCWYRRQTGSFVNTSMSQRDATRGTLYVSYDAATDLLHLSLRGYNANNAWETMPDLVGGDWGGQPIYIWLAGGSDGLAVTSGHVYFDNLVVDTGSIIEASLSDVYRFWSPSLKRYFYTISAAEREFLMANFASVWTYEGVVYRAYADDSDPDARPVYRFWSNQLSDHFYTVDEAEKEWFISQYSQVWTYEGVAFYAYPVGSQPPWARPVYRLLSSEWSTHFYTISETEKANTLAKHPDTWTCEGIAWYAAE
jgi:hypothetical protein